jgi:hypothetical protein
VEAETLAALKASIARWERNVAARTPKGAATNAAHCPLCHLFNNYEESKYGDVCVGCPVRADTGVAYCASTPYVAAVRLLRIWGEYPTDMTRRDDFRNAARCEVGYLKSLLPKGRDFLESLLPAQEKLPE